MIEKLLSGHEENGCDHSGHGTRKLAASQEWIDGINDFFACWHKFRKPESYFIDFLVGIVKNGPGF